MIAGDRLPFGRYLGCDFLGLTVQKALRPDKCIVFSAVRTDLPIDMHTRLRQTGMNRDRKGLFILFVQGDAVNIRHFDDVRKLFEIERYLVGNNSVHIVCHHAAIGIIEHGIVRVRARKREACFVRVNNILKRFFRLVGRLSLGDLPLIVLHIARFDRERHRGVRVVKVKHKAVLRLFIELDGLSGNRRDGGSCPIAYAESVAV